MEAEPNTQSNKALSERGGWDGTETTEVYGCESSKASASPVNVLDRQTIALPGNPRL